MTVTAYTCVYLGQRMSIVMLRQCIIITFERNEWRERDVFAVVSESMILPAFRDGAVVPSLSDPAGVPAFPVPVPVPVAEPLPVPRPNQKCPDIRIIVAVKSQHQCFSQTNLPRSAICY